MRIVRVRGRITEVVRLRCGGVACTRIARNITVDTADAVRSVASSAARIAITGLRCEITHRGNALVQRVIGEHARIIHCANDSPQDSSSTICMALSRKSSLHATCVIMRNACSPVIGSALQATASMYTRTV